ncbi:hypothetical protein DNTS_005802 [Danionella cerebrum]|nr:hypothetical protein DNTS_005802 [Danionella translucida]
MSQHSSLYSGQVQQQSSYYSSTQSASSALQQMCEMDLKLFGGGMDMKPGTPPVSARSTTPTSSPYR